MSRPRAYSISLDSNECRILKSVSRKTSSVNRGICPRSMIFKEINATSFRIVHERDETDEDYAALAYPTSA